MLCTLCTTLYRLLYLFIQGQPPFVLFQNFNFSARVCDKVDMISKALDVMHTLHSFLQAIIHNQSPFVLHQISSFMHWLTEKFV